MLTAIEGLKTVMMHSAELLLSTEPSQYTYSAGISFFDVVSRNTSHLLLSSHCRSISNGCSCPVVVGRILIPHQRNKQHALASSDVTRLDINVTRNAMNHGIVTM